MAPTIWDWSIGPFDWLLLRGRYGTAFKVPTLSDEFQQPSGGYSSVYDYLNCGRLGFKGANQANCPTPYNGEQYQLLTYGNPALKPITAKVWTYGFVLGPARAYVGQRGLPALQYQNEVGSLSSDSAFEYRISVRHRHDRPEFSNLQLRRSVSSPADLAVPSTVFRYWG